jgi:hypothetical protein
LSCTLADAAEASNRQLCPTGLTHGVAVADARTLRGVQPASWTRLRRAICVGSIADLEIVDQGSDMLKATAT